MKKVRKERGKKNSHIFFHLCVVDVGKPEWTENTSARGDVSAVIGKQGISCTFIFL